MKYDKLNYLPVWYMTIAKSLLIFTYIK